MREREREESEKFIGLDEAAENISMWSCRIRFADCQRIRPGSKDKRPTTWVFVGLRSKKLPSANNTRTAQGEQPVVAEMRLAAAID